jgi:hypothetical protein
MPPGRLRQKAFACCWYKCLAQMVPATEIGCPILRVLRVGWDSTAAGMTSKSSLTQERRRVASATPTLRKSAKDGAPGVRVLLV